MKVSIITVCHNQLAHTKRFIASLKRYTPQEPIAWQLIIFDSGSTDETWKWAEGEMVKHPLGTIETCGALSNVGWVNGINQGLRYVHPDSDIIIFANNDIVLDSPGWLERLCKHFDNPTVGAVGPTSNYVIGRQHVSCNVPHITEEETNTLIGFFFAVRKEIVDGIGPLEENFHKFIPDYPDEVRERLKLGGADDLDYSRRIQEAGFKLVIARDVFVWHAGSKTFMEVVGKDGYNQQWQAADVAFDRKWGEGSRATCFESPVKVAFGLPMRSNHPHWKFSKSLVYLSKPPTWNMIESPRCVVDQARNIIADTAIKLGIDYLLMLDDDHVLPHDLLFKLMSHGKDVCGALAFRRAEPYGPCVFSWQTHKENGNLMVNDRPDLIRKGLQKVDAVGFGAILIKVDVFKRLGPQPWFKFSEVGEDLHFCDLCAQNGIEVYCDTDLIIPHIWDEGMEITDKTFFEFHQAKAARMA